MQLTVQQDFIKKSMAIQIIQKTNALLHSFLLIN